MVNKTSNCPPVALDISNKFLIIFFIVAICFYKTTRPIYVCFIFNRRISDASSFKYWPFFLTFGYVIFSSSTDHLRGGKAVGKPPWLPRCTENGTARCRCETFCASKTAGAVPAGEDTCCFITKQESFLCSSACGSHGCIAPHHRFYFLSSSARFAVERGKPWVYSLPAVLTGNCREEEQTSGEEK